MKTLNKIFILLFGLLVMSSCKDDDVNVEESKEAIPATEEQMRTLSDQWYAELPFSGETDNWRTEEEGDMISYDHIGVIMYLNDRYTEDSYWGFIFMKDNEMVNYDGINRRTTDTTFDFKMDRDGNITILNPLADIPQLSNVHYDAQKDAITADVTYNGQTLNGIAFNRPSEEQQEFIDDFFETLLDAGQVTGYEDLDSEQKTGITDKNATEPSRAF